ncbi:unnamed protein product [Parascedosporium putredinis]|uniref:Endonuclease n=1 Tax=Parascedosporium putredinis TaxID=1442378 RepID=A0A9P1H1E0_9PEZI|nr:unnamed protein product [Parascedosporium putredinis]CAI7993624.1 unnamed protein product [Parascedosporium putredinis]
MVETRSHQYGGTDAQEASRPKSPPSKKATDKRESEMPQKRSLPDAGAREDGKVNTDEKGVHRNGGGEVVLANRVLDKYGDKPLEDLVDEGWPEGKMVMAHILNAMLSSARISHDIARSSLKALLDAGYEDLETLHKSTWEERTEVLTKGATRDLAAELKEIKGLGPLGVDICMGSMQGYFPEVAPFLDQRSLETARKVGLGDDVEAMFEALGSDAQAMARLEVGLTTANRWMATADGNR